MEAVLRSMVVEEDLHVLDTASRELTPRAAELLALRGGGGAGEELRNCVIRAATAPAGSATELRSALRAERAGLNGAGAELGLAVVAAGAVPLVPPGSALVDETPRTRRLLADYEYLARDQIYCGVRIRVEARASRVIWWTPSPSGPGPPPTSSRIWWSP